MNEFKVGDVVRVIKAASAELVGLVGIIVACNSGGFTIVRFLRDHNSSREYCFMTEQLTPINRDDYVKYMNTNAESTNHPHKTVANEIKNVIYNDPATIVFWTDGTKTVVKAENEDFDPEKGLAMAISKKMLGNKGNYYEVFKKWLPKHDRDMGLMFVHALFDTIMAGIGRNTEEYKCSTCARFDDENMSCMISNCEKYSRYVKKETHEKDAKEESKRNPVQEAYDKLIAIRDHDEFCDFDELIGLLGEALDS